MRSTQELREEIFRRAEHKKRAARALYRRMGTLCLLLCLCAGVTVWGMLGQTAPEQSLSTESTVSLQQTLQGDPSLPHEEENSAEGEEPSETVSDPGMEEDVSDESFFGDAFLPEESAPEEAPPEDEPDDPENPNEEGLLPTVILLNVNKYPYDSVMFYYTVQGMLTETETVLAPGDTVEVEFPDKVILEGCDSVLAVGEWQNGVFVVEKGDWMLFRDEMEDEDSSVLGPDSNFPEFDPPCEDEDPGLLPPDSSSVLTELLAEAGKFPVKDTSTQAALELFCALEQLYDEYGG